MSIRYVWCVQIAPEWCSYNWKSALHMISLAYSKRPRICCHFSMNIFERERKKSGHYLFCINMRASSSIHNTHSQRRLAIMRISISTATSTALSTTKKKRQLEQFTTRISLELFIQEINVWLEQVKPVTVCLLNGNNKWHTLEWFTRAIHLVKHRLQIWLINSDSVSQINKTALFESVSEKWLKIKYE